MVVVGVGAAGGGGSEPVGAWCGGCGVGRRVVVVVGVRWRGGGCGVRSARVVVVVSGRRVVVVSSSGAARGGGGGCGVRWRVVGSFPLGAYGRSVIFRPTTVAAAAAKLLSEDETVSESGTI